MLKSITTLFTETGLDEAPYLREEDDFSLAEQAAAKALNLPDTTNAVGMKYMPSQPNTARIATFQQEITIDAMAMALPEILSAAGYDETKYDLPVITEDTRNSLRVLAECATDSVVAEYRARNASVNYMNRHQTIDTVYDFCVRYVTLRRTGLCTTGEIGEQIRLLIRKAGSMSLMPEDLVESGCLPTDVPSFTVDDIKAAIEKYNQDENGSTEA